MDTKFSGHGVEPNSSDEPNSSNEMIGKIIHNFRIVAEIGQGGMGIVYLAEHLQLPKRFAIKSLSKALSSDPQFRSRFYEEAQKQAILDHPNIVQVTDFFEAAGQFFLVMDYVDGQDLSRLVKSKGRLPEREALDIFQDILNGLAFAHGKGLIHRDIKPSNVLVDSQGRARIMDFGIAILAGAGDKRLTATGATIGSPWYMSPEQIQRPKQLDRRTDIYSLGIVLYEMLAGSVPFDGETEFTVQEQQIHSPAPDLHQKQPDISPKLAQIVRRALAKDPAQRFQDCTEFLQHIRDYIRDGRETPEPQVPPRSRLVALAAAVLISVAIGYFIKIWPGQPSPAPVPPDPAEGKMAYNLIQTASEKALLICRELERAMLKKDTLDKVSSVDFSTVDSSAIDGLKRQVADIEKNISDAVPNYGDLLSQLAAIKSDIVDAEFERYAQSLTQKSSFDQIPTARMMKHHYVGNRQGGKSPDVDVLRKECRGIGTGA